MQEFAANFDRKNANIKEIRNDLMGIIGSNKPWEVAVGQVIGEIAAGRAALPEDNGITSYLGAKITENLLP